MPLFGRKSKTPQGTGDNLEVTAAPEPVPVAAESADDDVAEGKGEGLAQVNTTATQDIVYPSGLKLGLLLASVFITMFLVALVCCSPTPPSLVAKPAAVTDDKITNTLSTRIV